MLTHRWYTSIQAGIRGVMWPVVVSHVWMHLESYRPALVLGALWRELMAEPSTLWNI